MSHEIDDDDEIDPENPEWTEEMFAKAKGPESLPPHILAAFPNTRGRPKLPEAKQAVSIRLSPDVLAHYCARPLQGLGRRLAGARERGSSRRYA